MSLEVPHGRISVASTNLKTGEPVQGATWARAGNLMNWTLGRGGMLVPCYVPRDFSAGGDGIDCVLAAGSKYKFSYLTKPRYQGLERMWSVNGCGDNDPTEITLSTPGGTATTVSWGDHLQTEVPFVAKETSVTQIETVTAVHVTLSVTAGGGDALITGIGCTEVPRASLVTGSSEHGVDTSLLAARNPIDDNSLGLGRITDTLSDESLLGRRNSLLQWSVPNAIGGSSTDTFAITATTATIAWFQSVSSDGVPILQRRTQDSVSVDVYASALVKTTSGGRAVLRIKSNQGNTARSSAWSTLPVTSTSWEWTPVISFKVDTEDYSEAAFLRNGNWDWVYPQIRNLDSGKYTYCAAVSIWSE